MQTPQNAGLRLRYDLHLDRERGPSSPAEPELDEPSTTVLMGVLDRLLAR